MSSKSICRTVSVGCVALAMLIVGVGCGTFGSDDQNLPETQFPQDQDDGYQPGGGMMPTYVPTQDGYETNEPKS